LVGHADGAGVLAADAAVGGDARELDGVTRRREPDVGGARVDPEAAALAAVHGDGVAVGVEIQPRGGGGDGEVAGRGRQRGAGDGERRRGAAGGHADRTGVLAADGAVGGDARELDGVTRRREGVGRARGDAEAAALAPVHGDGVAVGVEVLPRRGGGGGEVAGRRRQRRAGGGGRRRRGAGGR